MEPIASRRLIDDSKGKSGTLGVIGQLQVEHGEAGLFAPACAKQLLHLETHNTTIRSNSSSQFQAYESRCSSQWHMSMFSSALSPPGRVAYMLEENT